MRKIKRSQLAKAKRLRKYTEIQSATNTKIISKVFINFGKQIASDNGTKFANGVVKLTYAKFERAMKNALKQVFGSACSNSAEYVNALFGWKLENSAIKSISNDVIREWNEKNAAKMVKNITDGTKKTINKIIENGQRQGINQKDIIKQLIDKVKDMSKSRARTIARTETSKAVNITTDSVAQSAGMKNVIWVYTHISMQPREAHQALGGTRIKMGETFNVNGNSAKHPHDPNLPAGEIINCQCIAIYE